MDTSRHQIALVPTHWKAGQPMFVFRDATSGRESYAAARFLMGEEMGEALSFAIRGR